MKQVKYKLGQKVYYYNIYAGATEQPTIDEAMSTEKEILRKMHIKYIKNY